MKKILPAAVAVLLIGVAIPSPSIAGAAQKEAAKTSESKADRMAASSLDALRDEWARIKYQVQGKDAKLAAFAQLEKKAAAHRAANPDSVEAKIWEGIILATSAGVTKSLGGLPKVEKAKALFEEAIRQDPRAMDGAAHMSLGSLYYQVPGWPVAFGDDDLAEEHLRAALAIDPDGMDTNYWYGAFLIEDGRTGEAMMYLKKAKAAPVRAERKIADEGRQQEIAAAIVQAGKMQKTKAKGNE